MYYSVLFFSRTGAPAPVEFYVSDPTLISLFLNWSLPSPMNVNGNVAEYEIQYHLVSSTEEENYEYVTVTETTHTLPNLSSGSTYVIKVCQLMIHNFVISSHVTI